MFKVFFIPYTQTITTSEMLNKHMVMYAMILSANKQLYFVFKFRISQGV